MARNNEPRLGCPSRSEGGGLSRLEASIVGSVLIYMIVLTGKLPRFIGDAGAGVVVVASPPPLKQFCVLNILERHGHQGSFVRAKAERWPAKVSAEVDNKIYSLIIYCGKNSCETISERDG